MNIIFQKLLGKLLKKAVNKAVNTDVPTIDPVEPRVASEVNLEKVPDVTIKTKDPMWVIVLKVLAYIIGLILGGVATTSCASHIF